MVLPRNSEKGMVIEFKTAPAFSSLEKRAEDAVEEIRTTHYAMHLLSEGCSDITLWGIFFFKKRCRVKVEKVSIGKS